MKILAVDSSSKTVSVAILEDSEIRAEFFLNVGLTHSQTLAPMTASLIKNADIKPSEIDLYAVTTGPGSFTGLRIGMSMIKGMALPYKKPCVGVSTLLAAAYQLKNFNGIICACLDARRGEVYNSLFSSQDSNFKQIVEDRAILIEDLKKELYNYDSKIKLVGDGAKICYNTIIDENISNKSKIHFEEMYLKASTVGLIARDFYENGKFCSASEIKPTYLKVSQAERMLQK